MMPAQLVALTDGPNILLDKPIVLVGRHQECDIQIPSRKISRRHCCIAQVNDHLVVRDLCSTNGIRINGSRVLEGNLRSGDELMIGNYRYQVNWAGQPPAAAAGAPMAQPIRPDIADSLRTADPLESCEEPVPLDEPVRQNVPVGPMLPTHKSSPPPMDPSLLIPENLNLAPSSDPQLPPAK